MGITLPSRLRPLALATAAAVLASVFVGVQPAVADTVPVEPTTPTTVSADALPTVQINGVVWTQKVVGNVVYVGGNFSTAQPAGSAPGANTVPRSNILAYDIRTGVLI
ncbi:PKD domain-containing protein, partial [Clavibacter lycopersici]